MFQKIDIKAYRGLKDITLDKLSTVNIIVGENNTGKTSVLEVIQLFKDQNVQANIINVAKRRQSNVGLVRRNSLSPFEEFLYAFPVQNDSMRYIEMDAWDEYGYRCCLYIDGEVQQQNFYKEELPESEQSRYETYCGDEGELRTIFGEVSYETADAITQNQYYFRETQLKPVLYETNPFQEIRFTEKEIVYISPLDIYSNKVINTSLYRGMRVEEKRDLIHLLQLFDERIIGVEIGIKYGKPTVFIEVEELGMMPIELFGDGLKKILTLASAVIKSENGIILIDEFETGIHQRALVQVAEWLFAAAGKRHIQIFLTSHSSDAIDALVQAQKKQNIDISAYRLEHYMGNTYVKQFKSEELFDLVRKQGMDIL